MVFQDLALWPHMRVAENIEFGLRARGIPREQRARRVREMVDLVRLGDYLNVRPAELSGGAAAARRSCESSRHSFLLLMTNSTCSSDKKFYGCMATWDLRWSMSHIAVMKRSISALGTSPSGRVESTEHSIPAVPHSVHSTRGRCSINGP
jgi:hypothetical protein